MFDLAEKRLVWIPVTWRGLKQTSPDALAEPTEFSIEVLAELLDRERMQEVFGGDEESAVDEAERERIRKGQQMTGFERFKVIVQDWRNIKQPFEDENIRKLLALPNFGAGFDMSYLKAWSGQIELATKNFESSRGSGPPRGANGSGKTKSGSAKRQTS
jgi:hypothetical protein